MPLRWAAVIFHCCRQGAELAAARHVYLSICFAAIHISAARRCRQMLGCFHTPLVSAAR